MGGEVRADGARSDDDVTPRHDDSPLFSMGAQIRAAVTDAPGPTVVGTTPEHFTTISTDLGVFDAVSSVH
jgi:hypothetical protein